MKREELISFMLWYKNHVPIGTMKSSKEIVDEYLASLSSDAKDEERAEEWFDNNFDCYATDEVLEEQIPAMTKEVFLQYARTVGDKPTVKEDLTVADEDFCNVCGRESSINYNGILYCDTCMDELLHKEEVE